MNDPFRKIQNVLLLTLILTCGNGKQMKKKFRNRDDLTEPQSY